MKVLYNIFTILKHLYLGVRMPRMLIIDVYTKRIGKYPIASRQWDDEVLDISLK